MGSFKFKNSRWLGLLAGFFGPIIGSSLYYLYYLNESTYQGVDHPMSLTSFIENAYTHHLLVQVLSIGSLLNIALFSFYQTQLAALGPGCIAGHSVLYHPLCAV